MDPTILFGTDDLQDPVKWAVRTFRNDKRNLRYEQYGRYLDGEHPLQFATPKYESAFGDLLAALWYDRTNLVVDAHADRLQVTGFNAKDETTRKACETIWTNNHMERREGEIETEAFGMGDGYVIVEKDPETNQVHFWPNEARYVRVRYSDEVPGRIDYAAKSWKTDAGMLRMNLYFPDRIEKYVSKTKWSGIMVNGAGQFERYGIDEDDWVVELEIDDTVPVFHIANNARTGRYGVSELRHILPMQDAMNKTMTDLMVAMEFGAFPQKAILGASEIPPAGTIEGDEYDQKQRAFELGIDRIMTITGEAAKIAEFSAIQLAQFIAAAEWFDQTISRISRIPIHYFSSTGDQQESGVSRRLREAPFVAKITDRHRSFGERYGDFVAYGLRLGGMADPGKILPEWQSPAPMSIDDQLSRAAAKVTMGIPLEFALRELEEYDEKDRDAILESVEAQREQARRQFNSGLIRPDLLDDEDVA